MYNSDGSVNYTNCYATPVNGCLVSTPNWWKHGTLDTETFNGTIIATADAPIIGMTNSITPGIEAFNIYESAAAKTSHFFPAAFANTASSYRNFLHIQNTTAVPVDITIELIDDILPTVSVTYQINGYGEFDMAIRDIFGGDFNGSIRVTATGNVAGMLRYEKMIGSLVEAMSIYESTTERVAVNFPYLYDGLNGYNNYISIFNPDPVSSVDCSLCYYKNNGTLYYCENKTLPPSGRDTITPCWVMDGSLVCDGTDQLTGLPWPDEFEGSMSGSCTGNVVATTNVIKFANVEGLNFHESTRPMQKMLFPQIYEEAGYSNTLHLLNQNSTPVTVTLTLKYTDGTVQGTNTVVIQPHAKHIMRPNTINDTVLPTNGSLAVDATPNTVTGVMVYELPTMITVYEGVEQQ